MIVRRLDVEFLSPVPFLMEGFVFELPGSSARVSRSDDPMLLQR